MVSDIFLLLLHSYKCYVTVWVLYAASKEQECQYQDHNKLLDF